jgi:hypothetical protein
MEVQQLLYRPTVTLGMTRNGQADAKRLPCGVANIVTHVPAMPLNARTLRSTLILYTITTRIFKLLLLLYLCWV